MLIMTEMGRIGPILLTTYNAIYVYAVLYGSETENPCICQSLTAGGRSRLPFEDVFKPSCRTSSVRKNHVSCRRVLKPLSGGSLDVRCDGIFGLQLW